MVSRVLTGAALLAAYLAPQAQVAAAPAVTDVPPLSAALTHRLARAENWHGARFLAWLPDGGMLLEAHTAQGIVLQRQGSPTAKPIEWARLKRPIGQARVPHTGNRVLFSQRRHGRTHWFLRDGRGQVRPFAAGVPVYGAPVWSAGGRRIAFLGQAPADTREALYIDSLVRGGLPRLVAGALAGRWRVLDWSAHGRRLLLAREAGPDQESLYTVRARDGALTRVPLAPARILTARFAPGGGAIDVVSDRGGDYERLWRVDPASGRARAVSAAVPWDVTQFAASPDGRYLAYTVDDDGRSHLHVRDRHLKLDIAVPWLRRGVISTLRFDAGHRLAFTFQSSRQPPEVEVYEAGAGLTQCWRAGASGALGRAVPGRARLVHYPTWDHDDGHWRKMSAYVYLPPGSSPAPVLVVLHPHPAGQFRPRWRPFLQFVVNDLGYAVIAPNLRGSSGYGRDFRTLVDGRHRDDAVRDIGSLMVWIGMQPGLDRHRIVLMGRGYGGWLAVNGLATFDGHLLGAIDINGIASLDDYIERAPPAERAFRRAEFGDARDPSASNFLRLISPLGEVDRIRSPLLIVQGLAGDAVRAADAQRLAYLLRFHNQRVELLTLADAGRRLSAPAARHRLYAAAAQFLQALKSHRAR